MTKYRKAILCIKDFSIKIRNDTTDTFINNQKLTLKLINNVYTILIVI